MTNESHSRAILNIDAHVAKDFDIGLAWIVETNVADVDLAQLRLSHLRGHLFLFIVPLLPGRCGHKASDLVESSLHFGNLLQVGVESHDIPDDLPVVQEVSGDLTRGELPILDRLGREKGNANKRAIEEVLEEEHHSCVIFGHVLANIVHTLIALREELHADLLT